MRKKCFELYFCVKLYNGTITYQFVQRVLITACAKNFGIMCYQMLCGFRYVVF